MNFNPLTSTPAVANHTVSEAGSRPIPTMEALTDHLIALGTDRRAGERARQVASENGQRLDTVLLRLGLVSERQMAEAGATLLATSLALSDQYPSVLPECAALLTTHYLRAARCLPLDDRPDGSIVAIADPPDVFTAEAIAAATGRPVHVQVAVPVELEAALNRLLPASDTEETVQEGPCTLPKRLPITPPRLSRSEA